MKQLLQSTASKTAIGDQDPASAPRLPTKLLGASNRKEVGFLALRLLAGVRWEGKIMTLDQEK